MRRFFVLLAVTVTTAGCMVGPDYVPPELGPDVAFREQTALDSSLANLDWWEFFEDPALRELIEVALEENKDLQAAYWRMEAAQARFGFTRANLFPRFDYRGGVNISDRSNTLGAPTDRAEEYSVSAGVSWEIDLWGRLRRGNEAARSEMLASEWGRRGLTVSLVSQVARLYFLLRDFDARLEIARSTLVSRIASTRLIRDRFEGGITSELDVLQAKVQESIAAVAVPQFERQIAQTENALSVLLGREPATIIRGASLEDQVLPQQTPAGLPSDLLRRRPDILQAEELLHAQMARIGVAQALRFPQLSLTGFFGFESADLSDVTKSDSRAWSIGAEILGPIFEFGKNKRRVQIERALTEELILTYENVVLQALREVEDTLIAIRKLREEHAARVTQVTASRQAAILSRARYDGGVSSYLEVLDTERSLFDSELNASRTRQEIYTAMTDLYAALGGGWDPEEPGHIPATKIPAYSDKEPVQDPSAPPDR